ncbi:MAG: hypothetical protein Kow0092_20440 [Deferrisomatales bacterium]
MLHTLGLSRDPFALGHPGALYWESPERAEARCAAEEALRSGRGVWVAGPAGSGRSAFALRVADGVAAGGMPALWNPGPAPSEPKAFLGRLLELAGAPQPSPGARDAVAGALYGRLVDAFCRGGPVLVLPGAEPLGARALEEVAMLAGLRLAGAPVAVPLLVGEGPSPAPGLLEVPLDAPGPEDLRACLALRAAVSGRPDLLPSALLDDAVAGARGFAEALARARDRAARRLFAGPERLGVAAAEGIPPPVLPEEQVDEVDRLLRALEPGRPGEGF